MKIGPLVYSNFPNIWEWVICGFYNFICFSGHECSQTKWLYQQQNVVLKCGLSLNDSVNKAPISGSSVSTIYKLLARETWQIAKGHVPHDIFSSVMLYFVNCYHWHKYLSAIKSKVDSSFSHTPHIELVGFDEIIVAYEGRDLFASRAVAMNEACSWHIKPLFQWIVNDNAPHAIKECYTFQTPEKNISIEHLSHLGASMESSLSRRGLEMFLVGARLSFSSVIVRRNKYT